MEGYKKELHALINTMTEEEANRLLPVARQLAEELSQLDENELRDLAAYVHKHFDFVTLKEG